MLIPDVNVLINAGNAAMAGHASARAALGKALSSPRGLGLTSVATSGCVRVNLQTRFKDQAEGISIVLDFLASLRALPACHETEPGPAHWSIFEVLVRRSVSGHRQVTDAWFAALAIENNATLMTFDGGFAQFPGLSWIHLKP